MTPTFIVTPNALRLIDQRLLPCEEQWFDVTDAATAHDAIKLMVVRGAPAIGVTAAFGMAFEARKDLDDAAWQQASADLNAARPTAVNLRWALERMTRVRAAGADAAALFVEAQAVLDEDVAINKAIGANGGPLMPRQGGILTHCNAGALATAGYGTALGVIRAAVEAGAKVTVYADETRPYLQGARLTAWELMADDIPTTLICDNMAAHAMKTGRIHAVVVGADRVAANGDAANKIGTLQVAIAAKHFGIPFYVAAPLSTIDLTTPTGEGIPIEERDPKEVTQLRGLPTAPEGVGVFNPAFDVTPAALITGLITEQGVVSPVNEAGIRALFAEE